MIPGFYQEVLQFFKIHLIVPICALVHYSSICVKLFRYPVYLGNYLTLPKSEQEVKQFCRYVMLTNFLNIIFIVYHGRNERKHSSYHLLTEINFTMILHGIDRMLLNRLNNKLILDRPPLKIWKHQTAVLSYYGTPQQCPSTSPRPGIKPTTSNHT